MQRDQCRYSRILHVTLFGVVSRCLQPDLFFLSCFSFFQFCFVVFTKSAADFKGAGLAIWIARNGLGALDLLDALVA